MTIRQCSIHWPLDRSLENLPLAVLEEVGGIIGAYFRISKASGRELRQIFLGSTLRKRLEGLSFNFAPVTKMNPVLQEARLVPRLFVAPKGAHGLPPVPRRRVQTQILRGASVHFRGNLLVVALERIHLLCEFSKHLQTRETVLVRGSTVDVHVHVIRVFVVDFSARLVENVATFVLHMHNYWGAAFHDTLLNHSFVKKFGETAGDGSRLLVRGPLGFPVRKGAVQYLVV